MLSCKDVLYFTKCTNKDLSRIDKDKTFKDKDKDLHQFYTEVTN